MPQNYKLQKFCSKIVNGKLVIINLSNELLENCIIILENQYSHCVIYERTSFLPKTEKIFNIQQNNFWENYKSKLFKVTILQYGHILHLNNVGSRNLLGYFVLFSNEKFADITQQLIIGLTRYSTYPILHFTCNYTHYYSHPNLENVWLEVQMFDDRPETIQLYKSLALIQALKSNIGYGVFLDSDVQVRSNISDLLDTYSSETKEIKLQKSIWDYTLLHGQYIPGPQVRHFFQMGESQSFPEGITNYVAFNQNHLALFEEWYSLCTSPEIQEIRKTEFLHDELLLNCLIWKKNINPKLLPYALNITGIKDLKFFYAYNNLENNSSLDLNQCGLGHFAQSALPFDKEQIRFFHCIKDPVLATHVNDLILEKEIDSHPNEDNFKTQLLNFYNNISVNPNRINQDKLKQKKETQEKGKVNINFINGAFFEILGGPDLDYQIDFIDKKNQENVYSTTLKPNHWCKTARRYFTDYNIQVKNNGKIVYNYDLDLKNKRVYVALDSKSLGDTIAWFPYVEEFRQQHGCEMVCSTFHNFLFKEEYPNITFVNPGEIVHNLFAMYEIGCFNVKERIYSPAPHNERPLQKVASELLGLEHKEIRPKIAPQPNLKLTDKKYICIAPESTAQCKFWNNPNGWTELVRYLKSKNYEVVNLNEKGTEIKGARSFQGSLKEVIGVLKGCEVMIGLGSGLSWLSWALNKQVVLISGFSYPWVEFQSNCVRISPKHDVCQGCYSTPGQPLDPSLWLFCPKHIGTPRHFECTKIIEASDVISKIEENNLF